MTSSSSLHIYPVDPADGRIQALITALDAYQNALYPSESNHLDPIESLQQTHVHFLGAELDGSLVGCGAVKLMPDGYGEINRMFVQPAARGHGVARQLLAALETYMQQAGIYLARLETGIHQHAALALYERCGYHRIDPFGAYQPDPLSVFMEKCL